MSERKNNRGKIEIMADILSLSTAGIRKTHIMYRANLSYEQILFYLRELTSKALIVQDIKGTHTTYRTTEKGREFLDCFSRLSELAREESTDSRLEILA
jgi:predicted transcriptional regulator